jgi:hypothetical protein
MQSRLRQLLRRSRGVNNSPREDVSAERRCDMSSGNPSQNPYCAKSRSSSSSSSRSSFGSGSGGSGGSSQSSVSSTSSRSSSSGSVACSDCLSSPSVFTVTLSGVTNGVCTDCGNLNSTFTLTNTGDCTWNSGLFTLCGVSYQFTLGYYTGSGETQLNIHEPAVSPPFLWTASGCPYSGMTLTSAASGGCNNVPSTVTLT